MQTRYLLVEMKAKIDDPEEADLAIEGMRQVIVESVLKCYNLDLTNVITVLNNKPN